MLWLHRTLTQAAITAGADAEVPGAVNVTLPGAKLQESPCTGGWRGTACRRPSRFRSRGRYVTRTHAGGWNPGPHCQPFVVELDPADLTAATPESGQTKPERPLVMTWCPATSDQSCRSDSTAGTGLRR
jgi:hypothetical protein